MRVTALWMTFGGYGYGSKPKEKLCGKGYCKSPSPLLR